MTDWYVIRLAPQAERRVSRAFGEIGVNHYFPHETRWQCRPGSRSRVYRPMLPGYGFVLISSADFYRVRETEGVSSFISQGGAPASIPPMIDDETGEVYDFAERMRMQEARGLFDFTQENKITFDPGQPVRVMQGKAAGLIGKVVRAKGDKRLEVLMNGLWGAGAKKMSVLIADLEAA